jgi:hypothetical protein
MLSRMDSDTIIGVIVLVVALAMLVGLTLWSRRRINEISQQGYRSARHILRTHAAEESADE